MTCLAFTAQADEGFGGPTLQGPQPQNPSANFGMEKHLFPSFVGDAKSCRTFSRANSCKVSEENAWICGIFLTWEKKKFLGALNKIRVQLWSEVYDQK